MDRRSFLASGATLALLPFAESPAMAAMAQGSGSGDAGRGIWKPAMEQYLTGLSPKGFAPPPDELVYGQERFDSGWDRFGDDQQFRGRR